MKKLIFCLIFMIISAGISVSQAENDFVIGKKYIINSQALNGEVTYQVHLPFEYEKSNKSYPVIYILNGHSVQTFAGAVATVENLSSERVPDMIIVGISNDGAVGNFLSCPDDSDRVIEADMFNSFLEKELLPEIKTKYRTNDYKILMGQSNTGLLAIYNLFRYPGMFNAHIVSSPMFGWCSDFYEKELKTFLDNNKTINKMLYISYGDLDYTRVIDYINAFEDNLKQNAKENLQWKIEKFENTGHVPFTTLNNALLYFFAECTMTSERMNFSTEQIKMHFNNISKKHGFTIYPKQYTLLKIAMELRKKKMYNEAIDMFDYSISIYPNSARNYYEKGIIYLSEKNPEDAKKCFDKSLEIEPGYERTEKILKRLNK